MQKLKHVHWTGDNEAEVREVFPDRPEIHFEGGWLSFKFAEGFAELDDFVTIFELDGKLHCIQRDTFEAFAARESQFREAARIALEGLEAAANVTPHASDGNLGECAVCGESENECKPTCPVALGLAALAPYTEERTENDATDRPEHS